MRQVNQIPQVLNKCHFVCLYGQMAVAIAMRANLHSTPGAICGRPPVNPAVVGCAMSTLGTFATSDVEAPFLRAQGMSKSLTVSDERCMEGGDARRSKQLICLGSFS